MTPQPELDFTQNAMQIRDAGIKTAADRAEHDSPGWKEDVYRAFKRFLLSVNQPFQMADFKKWYTGPVPEKGQAFGFITVKAKREGLIIHAGRMEPSKEPQSHCRPVNVWVVNNSVS